jgi:hypothetical protein
MRNMYGSYLESEMVQLAHHGIYPANASLYNTIKAKVLIWPSNYANAAVQKTDAAVKAAMNNASDIYVANDKDTVTITLPYTVVNNKDSFVSRIDPSKETEASTESEQATQAESATQTEEATHTEQNTQSEQTNQTERI